MLCSKARLIALIAGCTLSAAAALPTSLAAAVDRADVIAEVRHTSIYLQSGEIDTTVPGVGGDRAALAAMLKRESGRLGGRHYVVQFDGPVRPAWRERLANAGVVVGDYLPVNSLIVTLDRADAARVSGLEFVRWFSEFRPEWKIAAGIGARMYATPERAAMAVDGKFLVIVNLFKNEASRAVVDTISAMKGAQVHWVESLGGCEAISATVGRADLARIAALAPVQWVEEAPEITVRNDTDRWIVQSNVMNETPLYDVDIHGENQVLGLLDTRLDQNHCSFVDPINPIGPLHRKILAYNSSPGASFHGTHVCGTAVGDNGDNTATRGVAYAGKVVFNTTPAYSEMSMIAALDLHHMQGASVHTNSWGDDSTTAYNSLCRGIDVFSRTNQDDLVVFAVTNTGSLKNPENAKNLLAVGASQDSPSQHQHCSGGTGPTRDMRRKPEIYAPGCSTMSADAGTPCEISPASGTSMATPAISACAMMVRQYYQEGFYPFGARMPFNGFTPTGALIKATLLNSAVDMTGIAGYPSDQEGWGRVLLDNALFFSGDTRGMVIRDLRHDRGLNTGEDDDFSVPVMSNERLNVTLVWTDVAATAGANVASVNDLDLEVIGPDMTVYKGNVFANGQSVSGGTRDDRNNVEQVQLAMPAAGDWTIRVKGTAVNMDGPQGYAVVVTGALAQESVPMQINVTSVVPAVLPPNTGLDVDVTINSGTDTIVPGTALLYFRFGNGGYFPTPLMLISGSAYTGHVPAAPCGATPQFYVSVTGMNTGTITAPASGAAAPYRYSIGESMELASYDFESGTQGWTSSWPGDTTIIGRWERVVPIPNTGSPSGDHTPDAGVFAWVTGAESGGGGPANDVDGGTVSLVSPVYNLTNAVSANVSYWRWYDNSRGANPFSDVFLVQASGDNGMTWIDLEEVGPAGPESIGGWIFHREFLDGRVPFSPQVRIRFFAQDQGGDSLVEAGVDDVVVTAIQCGSTCACDWDGSGTLNSQDFFEFLVAFFGGNADFNADGFTNSQDFFDFVVCLFAGC